jgi:hypothetical protein
MIRRFMRGFIFFAGILLLVASARAQEASGPYTLVCEWNVQRALWPTFAAGADRDLKPLMQKALADGSITGWGMFETVVHAQDGPTHGLWVTADHISALLDFQSGLAKLAPNSGMAYAKHEDLLLNHALYHGKDGTSGPGYLLVGSFAVKAGQMADFISQFKGLFDASFEEMLKAGEINSFGLELPEVQTMPIGTAYAYVFSTDSKTMEKALHAIDGEQTKNPAGWNGLMKDMEVSAQRDFLFRVIDSARK